MINLRHKDGSVLFSVNLIRSCNFYHIGKPYPRFCWGFSADRLSIPDVMSVHLNVKIKVGRFFWSINKEVFRYTIYYSFFFAKMDYNYLVGIWPTKQPKRKLFIRWRMTLA